MLKIRIDRYNIYILQQDHYPSGAYVASNGVLIKSVSCPEARHDYCGNLHTIFLRGSHASADNRPIELSCLEDLMTALKILAEFCSYCGEAFMITEGREVIHYD